MDKDLRGVLKLYDSGVTDKGNKYVMIASAAYPERIQLFCELFETHKNFPGSRDGRFNVALDAAIFANNEYVIKIILTHINPGALITGNCYKFTSPEQRKNYESWLLESMKELSTETLVLCLMNLSISRTHELIKVLKTRKAMGYAYEQVTPGACEFINELIASHPDTPGDEQMLW